MTLNFDFLMSLISATLLIGILIRNISKPTRSLYDCRFKSYGSNSGFRVLVTVTLTLTYVITRTWHGALKSPCEEFVQYELVICRGYSFEKRSMLYNGKFGCHGNTCYVILIGAVFLHRSNQCVYRF